MNDGGGARKGAMLPVGLDGTSDAACDSTQLCFRSTTCVGRNRCAIFVRYRRHAGPLRHITLLEPIDDSTQSDTIGIYADVCNGSPAKCDDHSKFAYPSPNRMREYSVHVFLTLRRV